MSRLEIALLNVLLPASVCGVVLAIAWLSQRPRPAGDRQSRALPSWLGALALLAAFLVAHVATLGWPWSGDWEHSAAHAALTAGLAAVLTRFCPPLTRLAIMLGCGMAVSWLVAGVAIQQGDYTAAQKWIVLASLAVAIAVVMYSTAELSQHTIGWSWTLPMLPTFAAAAWLCLRAEYAKFVQLAISAAAAVAAGMVIALWLRRPLGRGFGALAAAVLAIILLGGYFHGPQFPPDDPSAAFVLVGLSPLAMWVGRSRSLRSRSMLVIASVQLAAVLAILGIAALLAIRLAGFEAPVP